MSWHNNKGFEKSGSLISNTEFEWNMYILKSKWNTSKNWLFLFSGSLQNVSEKATTLVCTKNPWSITKICKYLSGHQSEVEEIKNLSSRIFYFDKTAISNVQPRPSFKSSQMQTFSYAERSAWYPLQPACQQVTNIFLLYLSFQEERRGPSFSVTPFPTRLVNTT